MNSLEGKLANNNMLWIGILRESKQNKANAQDGDRD
jgi:hypothetical protein